MGNDVDILNTPQGLKVRVKGEALFVSGSTKLNPGAVPLLDGVASVLRKTKFGARVEGHSDNVPMKPSSLKSAYINNWELSSARAAAVVRYLIFKKVDPSQLSAVGYADIVPVVSNETSEGRAKNRRVEFYLDKK